MKRTSAGLLMFRRRGSLEVLLAHPGGPLWSGKDLGAWSIPKGNAEGDEELLAAAIREFEEETGFSACAPYRSLGHIRMRSGREVHVWAFEGDCDPRRLRSNTFKLEWPPKSGREREYPEMDRAEWFELGQAREKLLAGQHEFLERLAAAIADRAESDRDDLP